MDYLNTLNESGRNLLNQVLESGKYKATDKLILAIKSIQCRIISIDQDWIIEKKGKRGGKLDLHKFRQKFFGEKL